MKKSKIYYIGFLLLILIIGIALIDISYSKFLYNGSLYGVAVVPSKQDSLLITDVSYLSGTNVNELNNTINEYEHTNVDSSIVLNSSSDSSITYQVTITNYNSNDVFYTDSEFISTDNPAITYKIDGLLEGKKLEQNESVTFNLTFKYDEGITNFDNNTLNSIIRFNFTNIDPFPYVFNHAGACIFNGSTGNITGDNCTEYHDVQYIDTGVTLYDSTNYLKDYEISFIIDSYNPNNQGSEQQQTLFNNKSESGDAPGIVFRRSGTKLELSQKIGNNKKAYTAEYAQIQKVQIIRRNNIVYYKINDGAITTLQSMANFTQFFDNTAWFGAATNSDGTPFRIVRGTISNMSIRLGKITETKWEELNTVSNTNNGTNSIDDELTDTTNSEPTEGS